MGVATLADDGGIIGKDAGWLEQKLGTENYRTLRALLTNPVSVAGFVLLGLFLFVAAAAPILAPPRMDFSLFRAT